jgi:hypothetical protein
MAKLIFTPLPKTAKTLFFDACEVPRERLLTHYLVYSAAYYVYGESLITDYEYDKLAETLMSYINMIEHIHSHIVDRDFLATSSSGFYIEFSPMILGCAEYLIKYKQQNNKLPDL